MAYFQYCQQFLECLFGFGVFTHLSITSVTPFPQLKRERNPLLHSSLSSMLTMQTLVHQPLRPSYQSGRVSHSVPECSLFLRDPSSAGHRPQPFHTGFGHHQVSGSHTQSGSGAPSGSAVFDVNQLSIATLMARGPAVLNLTYSKCTLLCDRNTFHFGITLFPVQVEVWSKSH